MRDEQEHNEFCDLTNLLTNVELDDKASKNRTYNRLKFKIEAGAIKPDFTKKDEIMLKNKKWKSVTVSAIAVICLTGAFSTTSFAQGMLESILARFQVGNLQIVQYDKEPSSSANNSASEKATGDTSRVELQPRPELTVQEARSVLGLNFPAPTWLADYQYVNTVIHGTNMAEVQFAQGEKMVNFLISKGGENGIGTTDEVKKEVIHGTTVYFANGIVIWENEGFTVELYAQEDFDNTALGKIIEGFKVGTPPTQTEINQAKEKLKNATPTEAAGPAPAPASSK
ncbi:hypothetical protein [Brevibacillus reuszeri]|uniref:hypothetical protein n=1 Tax=Brevibacillus reuszeri TaxID=54915 RepID=UPI0028982164|nr:hypothetical protein [Brevibacillus reuszeri]